MERNLFAKVHFIDGRDVTLGHFIDELGSRAYNYNTFKSIDMRREEFIAFIDKLKHDKIVSCVETWEGLLKGEYINIHTGKVEKIFGF